MTRKEVSSGEGGEGEWKGKEAGEGGRGEKGRAGKGEKRGGKKFSPNLNLNRLNLRDRKNNIKIT